jgi:hypothetical protein
MRVLKLSVWLYYLLLLLFASCALKPKKISPLSLASPLNQADLTPHASLLATTTPDPAISPLIISEVIHISDGSEIIIIKNITSSEQNITGWAILDHQALRHIFLPNVTLPPEGTFRVCNGPCPANVAVEMRWLDQPVLHDHGDLLLLLNPSGRVVWNYVYLTDHP